MPDMSVREVPAGPGPHPSYQAGIARLVVTEGTGAELGQGWIWAWG